MDREREKTIMGTKKDTMLQIKRYAIVLPPPGAEVLDL